MSNHGSIVLPLADWVRRRQEGKASFSDEALEAALKTGLTRHEERVRLGRVDGKDAYLLIKSLKLYA